MHHQEIAREIQLRDDFELPFDLRVGRRGAGLWPVAFGRTEHHQLAQPAVLGMTFGHIEGRQPGGDQRQLEGALLAEIGCGGDDFRTLGEQPGHLRTGTQMRAAQRGQPAGRLLQ